MIKRRRIYEFLMASALLLAPGCAAPQRVSPVEVKRSDWSFLGARGTELVTEHYRIRTTCLEPRLVHMLPEFLESCWSAYSKMMPSPHEPERPAMSYLFQTRPQWERFTSEFSPGRAATYLKIRSGGYEERGITVAQYDTMASAFAVMSHEGLHQYISVMRGGRIPAWANEGLACYYESFELDDDGRATFLPRRNLFRRDHLREALMKNALFDFRELLSTNAGRVVSLPSSRVRTYYAQAWSVVLFMLELDPVKDPWGAGFRSMLADLGTEAMSRKVRVGSAVPDDVQFGEAVFRTYVTTDLPAFEKRYLEFVRPMLGLD